jgi:hypothetical protein
LPHFVNIDTQLNLMLQFVKKIPTSQTAYRRLLSTSVMSLQKELIKEGDKTNYPKKGDQVTMEYATTALLS